MSSGDVSAGKFLTTITVFDRLGGTDDPGLFFEDGGGAKASRQRPCSSRNFLVSATIWVSPRASRTAADEDLDTVVHI